MAGSATVFYCYFIWYGNFGAAGDKSCRGIQVCKGGFGYYTGRPKGCSDEELQLLNQGGRGTQGRQPSALREH